MHSRCSHSQGCWLWKAVFAKEPLGCKAKAQRCPLFQARQGAEDTSRGRAEAIPERSPWVERVFYRRKVSLIALPLSAAAVAAAVRP